MPLLRWLASEVTRTDLRERGNELSQAASDVLELLTEKILLQQVGAPFDLEALMRKLESAIDRYNEVTKQ